MGWGVVSYQVLVVTFSCSNVLISNMARVSVVLFSFLTSELCTGCL